MNKRRRFKAKRRRLVLRYAQQTPRCSACGGSGQTDTHECYECEGSGCEPVWQYAALLEWVLFGTFRTKGDYETFPLSAGAAIDPFDDLGVAASVRLGQLASALGE